MAHVCHYVMTHVANSIYYTDALKLKPTKKQYSLKAGLRCFHVRGNAAVVKELTQFHTPKCFCPRDLSTLSREDRRKALTFLMFLTEKRSGEIKACACANGSTQRLHIAKDEATAPTVTLEAILSRVPYLLMKEETLPLVTYLVLSFRRTILTMS